MVKIICRKKRNPSTKYILFFNYNKNIIDRIKSLPEGSREYNSNNKTWELTSILLYDLIKSYKGSKDIFFDFESENNKQIFLKSIEIEKDILIEKERNLQSEKQKQIAAKKLKDYLNENANLISYSEYLNKDITPFNHQLVGAKLFYEFEKFIISADMGTGKTLMAILGCEMKRFKKVLVIVPNNLKLNWRNEIKTFTSSKWFILNPQKKKTNIYTIEESKYIIVNYEYFRDARFNPKIKLNKLGLNPSDIDCIVMDEAHRIKNPESNTTKNILSNFKNINGTLLLSGTIMPNRLEELYVITKLILPNEVKNKSYFFENFCGKIYDKTIGLYVDKEGFNLDDVFNKLDGIMYRVKKHDVLKDLPEMIVSKIDLELTSEQQKQYELIESGFFGIDLTDYKENAHKLSILNKLRQFTSKIKCGSFLVDFIQNLNNVGEKVVIFDVYKAGLKELSDIVPNSKYYSGDVSPDERQNIVDQFQDKNNTDVMNLFITLQSGNAGITLTAANYMILLNQSYVPGENLQAYSRINRIGAKNTSNIYILCLEDTIDQDVYNLNQEKIKLISKVIDNVDYIDNANRSVLDELFSKIENKYKKK